MANKPSGPPEDMDAEQLWDKYLRSLAENENMRKRHLVELEKAREEGVSSAIREVLPIVDDLQRGNAVAQATKGRGSLVRLREGFSHVASKAQQTLKNIGVEEFETAEQDFDPNTMEAIARTPTLEVEPGKVIGVVEPGYLRKGKLLRAAKVAVAMEPDKEEENS